MAYSLAGDLNITEPDANTIAGVLGGEVWSSRGDINLVLSERAAARIVAMSDEVVCEYANRDELDDGKLLNSITLV
jgi:hypothetical protein